MTRLAHSLPDRPEFRHPASWAVEDAKRIVRMHLQGTGVCAHLYGSRARGNARRFSDIDIALSAGNRPVPAAVLAALAESL